LIGFSISPTNVVGDNISGDSLTVNFAAVKEKVEFEVTKTLAARIRP
jgi:hypothetical protein